MKLSLIMKLFVVVVLAVALFGATSLIDMHGPAVSGWQYSDEAPYRHAKGVPLMYLQRSLPDGVWQTNNRLGQSHYFNNFNLAFDAVFWLLVSGAAVTTYSLLRKPHKS